MSRIRYTTCPYCLERQDVGGVFPGTKVICLKCGERFPLLDPKLTGTRGLIRRTIGIAVILLGVGIIATVLLGSSAGTSLDVTVFEAQTTIQHAPVVTDFLVQNDSLGYELQLPGTGWTSLAVEDNDPAQARFRDTDRRAEFILQVVSVSPGLDTMDVLRQLRSMSDSDARRLLGRATAREIRIQAFRIEVPAPGGQQILSFDFAGPPSQPSGMGFLILTPLQWYWLFVTAPPRTLTRVMAEFDSTLQSVKIRE